MKSRAVRRRSMLRLGDLFTEALAGILQRPARSTFTMLGTTLGIGSLVAILGLTSTAAGQVGQQFDALRETTVTVTDHSTQVAHDSVAPPPLDFPSDAEDRARGVNGVVAAGVYWALPLHNPSVSKTLQMTPGAPTAVTVYAASPGFFSAIQATLDSGRYFNEFHEKTLERLVVLGASAADQLGITQTRSNPAVFINDRAFTVVGILRDSRRFAESSAGVFMPASTGLALYGPPDPSENPAQMIVETRLGAAQTVASEIPEAFSPAPVGNFEAVAPPDPRMLFNAVHADLNGLFVGLAMVSLIVGAIGIMNTTLVAVLERFGEIGLRRALGARRRHIAYQFLAESALLGSIGGLVGTGLGVGIIVIVAVIREWTAVVDPITVFPAPILGTLVGTIAGTYPALRAAWVEPLEALRR